LAHITAVGRGRRARRAATTFSPWSTLRASAALGPAHGLLGAFAPVATLTDRRRAIDESHRSVAEVEQVACRQLAAPDIVDGGRAQL
jgi:hypothetical protein